LQCRTVSDDMRATDQTCAFPPPSWLNLRTHERPSGSTRETHSAPTLQRWRSLGPHAVTRPPSRMLYTQPIPLHAACHLHPLCPAHRCKVHCGIHPPREQHGDALPKRQPGVQPTVRSPFQAPTSTACRHTLPASCPCHAATNLNHQAPPGLSGSIGSLGSIACPPAVSLLHRQQSATLHTQWWHQTAHHLQSVIRQANVGTARDSLLSYSMLADADSLCRSEGISEASAVHGSSAVQLALMHK
jgi:hypothetical protein